MQYSTWEPADNFLDKTPIIQFEERMKAENEAEKDNKALVSKKEGKAKKRKQKPEASTSKEAAAKKAKEEPPPKATLSGRVSKAPERYTKVIDEEANAKENKDNSTATTSNNKTEDETSTSRNNKAEAKKDEKTPEKRQPEKQEAKKDVNRSPMPQEVKSNHDLQLVYPGVYALNRIQMLNRAQILKDKQRRLSALSANGGDVKMEHYDGGEDEEEGEETAEQFTEWFPPDTWSYLHQVTVTDVTVGDVTATMREASSPEGFFKNSQSLSNPSA